MGDFYFPYLPSSPLLFPSSSHESDDSSNQNISTSSGSEASSGQNISTASSHASNGLINQNPSIPLGTVAIPSLEDIPTGFGAIPSLEVISLNKLSSNLEQLLIDCRRSCYYGDAEIVVEGRPIPIHRYILAVRSRFFDELFTQEKGSLEEGGKPRYFMSDLLPHGKVGYEAFLVFLSYLYTGKLKPSPLDVSTCVAGVCAHDACRPAINFTVELLYASSIFQVPELVNLFQRRLANFVNKAYVEDVIPICLVAFHCQSSQLVAKCMDRIARSDLDSISLEKDLPYQVSKDIKFLRKELMSDDEQKIKAVDPLHEMIIKRIHETLDLDDIEQVKLVLTDSDVTLDDANALHYAAAHCSPKIVYEVLGLGLADVNLRNSQGYTGLHIAALRREPSVIVSLLAKGACVLDLTLDGRSAVSICRRLTRPKDYHAKTETGQEANKDRLCIDLLEREMWRNPRAGDASFTSLTIIDDLDLKIAYLENRAKVAMEIAYAEKTSEFASKRFNRNFRELDLNETLITRNKRLLSRLEALNKAVEIGRRFFPNCSQVLDQFMEDDSLLDLFYLEKDIPEEQRIKRVRFMELKEETRTAFSKDEA
ncbi:BTB/POZ domain and ankyrin repeat-containing protein NPR1-like isoform X2 [Hevea brasiliensis]|uniref:BTB/POZ domain and ankyrin repeat-containing protein NPR1-like isoform X2 n=1 Tax=Hevea brasiliensis TaxID=3981 RepID=UPI0025E04BA4|nr:BTB/POZ domain and ankyrin repeat-containing protein NPR1-like isoform X2 [Hevea brasiliensis]